ncbi:MAG: YebC/PmpR family DNA-binding transcriptional regulator [Candidatus Cloacimonadota bacterium]|nr:YebC/PmpR family DNA-binding transcriptional regulator [Candidatus Cloacimonadota bacterium]
MSGHSKWSSIKHKKGAADKKRGKLFTRLGKEIIIAARDGGGDEDNNPRLRTAIQNAKNANMPKSNIKKAIQRGTGEIEGANYEQYTYEGYGQGGVAILIEVLTENKNRTVAEIRHCFSKYGGNMGESGAVSWNFDHKGSIIINSEGKDEDDVMMEALEAGAEDMLNHGDTFEIITAHSDLHDVLVSIEKSDLKVENASLTQIPKNTIKADDVAEKLLHLIDQLEDLDDTQKVFSNYEISDDVFDRLSQV